MYLGSEESVTERSCVLVRAYVRTYAFIFSPVTLSDSLCPSAGGTRSRQSLLSLATLDIKKLTFVCMKVRGPRLCWLLIFKNVVEKRELRGYRNME